MKKYLPHVAISGLLILTGLVAVNNSDLSFLSQPMQGYTCPSVSSFPELKAGVVNSLCNKLTSKYATDTASITWLNAVKAQFARAEEKKRNDNLLVATAMFSYMKSGTEKAIFLKNNPIDEEGDTLKEIDTIG